MARILAIIMVCWSMLLLTSCFDPEPGEISVRCKKNGQMTGCAVQVWNSNDQQIQLIPTDMSGLKYIELPPGKYTLRFTDNDGNEYPAVKVVDLKSGSSAVVDVELTEEPAIDP